jgi:hypothetical protein
MSSRRGPKMKEPTHEQVYQFLQQHPKPFAKTSRVAEEYPGPSERTIRERLRDLRDDGRIRATRVGDALVWWLEDYSPEDASSARPASDNQ